MGVGNHTYRNRKTGAIVTAARILKGNLKISRAIAGVRPTGDKKTERYAVSTGNGDVQANPGDWVIFDGARDISVMTHADFAIAHEPALLALTGR